MHSEWPVWRQRHLFFFKTCCFRLRRQLQTFVFLKLHFPWSTGCKHPISHNIFFLLYMYFFFSLVFSLIYLYIYFFAPGISSHPSSWIDQPQFSPAASCSQSGAGVRVGDRQWWGQRWEVTEAEVSSSSAQVGHPGVCVCVCEIICVTIRLWLEDL